jgi:hypothetical protein
MTRVQSAHKGSVGNSSSSLNFLTNTRLQKHQIGGDKSLNTVLSGKNLLNLTQSAAARASREQKVTGPFQANTVESPQGESVEIQKIFSGMQTSNVKSHAGESVEIVS